MEKYSETEYSAPEHQDSLQGELFQAFTLPRHKLDADQYMADDLEGVTESLFGSGNLNYLILQSGLSDTFLDQESDLSAPYNIEDFQSLEFFATSPGFLDFSDGGIDVTSNMPVIETQDYDSDGYFSNFAPVTNNLNSAAISDAAVNGFDVNPLFSSSDNFTNNTSENNNTVNGTDGRDGRDGSDGGTKACDDSCGNSVVNIEGPILNIDLGDIILGDLDIDTIIGDTLDFLSVTLDQVLTFIGNIDVTGLIEIITDFSLNLVQNISDSLANIIDTGNLLTLDLNAVVGEISDIALDVETITGDIPVLDQTLDLTKLTETLDNIIQLGDFEPLSLHAFLNALNPEDAGTDDTDLSILADINLAGMELPVIDENINLDPVEAIVGDIDVDLSLVQDLSSILESGNEDTDLELLGQNITLDPIEDLAGDVDLALGLDHALLDPSGSDNDSGDYDVVLETDIDLVDQALSDGITDIELDAVENITGDLDIDLTVAADVLGDAAEPLLDDFDGGNDGLLSDIGAVLSDTVGSLLPSEDSADDTDLTIGLDSDLTEELGLDVEQDINLDIIEELTHDIDIDVQLDSALDLLTDSHGAGEISDVLPIDSWTENTILDSEDVFAFGTDGIGLCDSVLPGGEGSVVEGIGGLDLDIGSEGGILGGGLFG